MAAIRHVASMIERTRPSVVKNSAMGTSITETAA
jgi:hypothetical protein